MGNRLKEIRMKRGLVQWKLAKAVGVHECLISSVEIGRRRCPKELKLQLANILGVSVDELFPSNEKAML